MGPTGTCMFLCILMGPYESLLVLIHFYVSLWIPFASLYVLMVAY